MKKIVFIASYPQSLLRFRLALMQDFLKQGYCVVALAPHDKEVAEVLQALNIKFIPINMQRNGLNPFADINLLFKLWKILRNEKPDLIFSYTIKPVIYGSFAAKLAGVPKIYSMITGTGYVFLNVNFKSRVVGSIARTMFRAALHFNTRVFFQNPDNLKFFQQTKIITEKKPATIVNGSGVDCDEFAPATYPRELSFLMIARLLRDKGVHEYVEAARRIKQRYAQIKFQLVGWIDTNPNSITQQELEGWINEGTIEFLGKLSDVRHAISNSSVYVLPSYHEGTPRTVLEAMAMARPIITTDAPGCKETVIQHQNGFLVAVKNVEELFQAMEYFILSPEMISIMGVKSRELAVEKYDVNKVNKSMLQVMT